jgi:hypothetical protein
MLLTSTSLQVSTIALAVAATAAALLLWNRVRGPQAVRVASRAGLLVGGYVATAVAVLISVNIAYGGLIVSWSDLFTNVNPPMPHFRHSGKGHGVGHFAGESGWTRPMGADATHAAKTMATTIHPRSTSTVTATVPTPPAAPYGLQARPPSLGSEK